MKRRFIFEVHTRVDPESIPKFGRALLFSSNHQSIINSRFSLLIQSINSNRGTALASTSSSSTTQPSTAKVSPSNSESNVTEMLSSTDKELSKHQQKLKSYLMPNDLHDDLVECKCDSYMQVKSGSAEVIPDKFKIETLID
jgi:hypothetical protein